MRAADPEIFGFATTNVALVFSACAALFSGGSLIYVWRTVRRAGALVTVILHADPNLWVRAGSKEPVLIVEAHNLGMAKVQATNLYFEVKGADPLVPRAYISGEVPTVIEGLHATKWVLAPDTLASARGSQVRAIVLLAGLKRAASKWTTLNA